jgi:hypothetical protein
VIGVSVHDARIVAQMKIWQISTTLTFNASDFRRFSEIAVQTPATLLASASAG